MLFKRFQKLWALSRPSPKNFNSRKNSEYHKISHSTANILYISPVVPYIQIVERKPLKNYGITANGQKEISRNEKSENKLANLDVLKTKLDKVSSSNQPSTSVGRADLSTNKNTPHPTAFNSENNSLQSIPLTSLTKLTKEHQRDAIRYCNSSKFGTLLIYEQPDSSEKPPNSNYSSRSFYIKVNELLPSATYRELRHSHRAVSQYPLLLDYWANRG